MTAEDSPAAPRGRGALGTALLVAGIVLVAVNLRAPYTGVGPLLDAIRAEFGLSATAAGVLSSLPLFAFGVISPIAAGIARRFGMERTLFAVLIVLVLGLGLRWVPLVSALFAGTAILGAAIAVANVMLPSLVKRDFPANVTVVTSLYVTCMSFVGALAAGIAVPIADAAPGGWRMALGCWAALAVLALVVWAPQLVRARTAALQRSDAGPAGPPLWRSVTAWKVTAYMGLQSFAFYVVISWEPTVLQQRGFSAADTGWLIFILQGLGVPAGFVIPLFVRYVGSHRLLAVLCSLGCLIGYSGLTALPQWALLWMIVIGPCSGACFVLALAFISLRAGGAREAAALSGMAQSIGYLLAAAGPALFGVLHDATGVWLPGMLLLIGTTALQAIAAYAAGGPGEIERG
jgi:CP family cyanate transporter-like MFS transporter